MLYGEKLRLAFGAWRRQRPKPLKNGQLACHLVFLKLRAQVGVLEFPRIASRCSSAYLALSASSSSDSSIRFLSVTESRYSFIVSDNLDHRRCVAQCTVRSHGVTSSSFITQ